MSNNIDEDKRNKIEMLKEEEEKKKYLLIEEKQPEEPLPVGEGHETKVEETKEDEKL